MFSAISAMTPGQRQQDEVELELPARAAVGKPNQAASDTPLRSTRKWVVTSPAPVGAVISPTILSSTQDSTKPKISARKIAIRDQKPRKATAATMVNTITVNATPGSCGQ